MRTEVKIGAAIAFVVVVIGVWFVIFSTSARQAAPTPKSTPSPKPTNVVETDRPRTPAATTRRTETPATSLPASRPVDRTRRSDATESPWWLSGSAGKTSTSAPTPSSLVRGSASRPSDAARTPVPAVAASMPSGASHTYKVKLNDTYWSIAKMEYGDGSLYAVIQNANKNAGLHEGMTITIPSKPAPSAAVAPAPGAAAPAAASIDNGKASEGAAGVDQATGKRFYVIKAGDNRGFYGIARDALGDVRLVKQIEDANPGVDPKRLRIGQKIWIPSSATVSSRPAVAVTGATSRPSRPTAPRPAQAPRATPVPTPAPAPAAPAPAAPSGSTFD
jgi:nucleoid-associated protein YgaU